MRRLVGSQKVCVGTVGQKPPETPQNRPVSLNEQLRKAREAHGFHHDALVGMGDSQTLRLEVLRLELCDVLEGLPETQQFLDPALSLAGTPRLWIDLTTYVVMAPTARTYRLVRDRLDGSQVLFETRDRAQMLEKITFYAASRLVEREKQMAGPVPVKDPERQSFSLGAVILAWVAGFVLGALVLLAAGRWPFGS